MPDLAAQWLASASPRRWTARVLLGLGAGLLLALLAIGLQPRPVMAAGPFTVSKTADTNDGVCDSDCHSTRAWLPATFNHSGTGFNLTGAHTSLSCSKCHTGSSFGGLSPTCSSCHSRPSNHPSGYTTCSQCHSTSAWTPVRFSGTHTFPIRHGGANGICWTCHTTSLSSYTCAKCHNPANIDGHAGRSSSQCASCHPTGGGGG